MIKKRNDEKLESIRDDVRQEFWNELQKLEEAENDVQRLKNELYVISKSNEKTQYENKR